MSEQSTQATQANPPELVEAMFQTWYSKTAGLRSVFDAMLLDLRAKGCLLPAEGVALQVERDSFRRNMEAAAELAARYGAERDAHATRVAPLEAALREIDRLSLVIDSAVRNADPQYAREIDAAIGAVRRAILAPPPEPPRTA